MSQHRENYRGVPDGDFELMPEGNYPVKVTNATVGQAKSSGKDTWCLELEIVGQNYAGRKLWLYHGMSEEARPMRKGTIRALGLDPEMEIDLVDDVLGCRATAVVFHDTYNGQLREKVKRLRSMEQVAPGQMKIGEVESSDEVPFS